MLYSGARGARNGRKSEWRMPTRAKWYHLYEENEDFRIWFDNLARGSPTTAVETTRYLYRYLKIREITIDELTNELKEDQEMFEKRLLSFVSELESHGYAPGTISNYLKAIKSWANHQNVSLVKKVKISNKNFTPTLEDEKVPTIEEVLEIRSNASLRGRICVGGVAYAGLRPESLGHQRLEDGIRLGDLPEFDIDTLEFQKTPTQVFVRAEISKAGHTYRTFFPDQLCRDIEAYLQHRRKIGEILDISSPLVAVASSHVNKGGRVQAGRTSRHITRTIVSRDIRKAMRPRFPYRPYVLRSFFSTRLLLAQSERVVDRDYRVYWMGHTGNMSARYSSNKSLLPDDLIEDMRNSYEKCMPYLLGLGTNEEALRRKNLQDTIKLMSALNPSLNQSQIGAIMNILENSESVDNAITEITRSGIAITQSMSIPNQFRTEQRLGYEDYLIVDESHLTDYLKQGYEWVRELGAEKPKDTVSDEVWNMPNGETIENRDKMYAEIIQNGTVEMRGSPSSLNEIEDELAKLGVSLEKVEQGKRYLLRKKE